MRIVGVSLLLRRQRRRDRTPARTAGKYHLPAFRVGDRRRIEARQWHHDGVRIALDLDLVRFTHVDEEHAAFGQPASDILRRQIMNAGITSRWIGHAVLLLMSVGLPCRQVNKSRGTMGESRETFAALTAASAKELSGSRSSLKMVAVAASPAIGALNAHLPRP